MILALWDQFWCGLKGHDDVLKSSDGKLYVECIHCLYRSSGVKIGSPTYLILSAKEIDELFRYMSDVESSLLGGG